MISQPVTPPTERLTPAPVPPERGVVPAASVIRFCAAPPRALTNVTSHGPPAFPATVTLGELMEDIARSAVWSVAAVALNATSPPVIALKTGLNWPALLVPTVMICTSLTTQEGS